ncbi:MAG: NAD(P)/FAD-dependent oxidoreductase, partial [Gammaproteobacteria bacterium]
MKHVIIGAGPAGVIAAETIRKVQPDSSVTIIGDESEPPYSRMAIPYYLIDHINEKGTYLRKTDSHFADAGIDVVRDRVSSIDTKNKKLSLEDGSSVDYDKLLI